MRKCKQGKALKSVLFVLIILMGIFVGSTILWILITPFKFEEFNNVLSLILKNAGSYSTLLVGIAVTTFYQIYVKEREVERKIK